MPRSARLLLVSPLAQLLAAAIGASPVLPQPSPCAPLRVRIEAPGFVVREAQGDTSLTADVTRVLRSALVQVTQDYEQPMRHRVVVEIHPSQSCYDLSVTNPRLRGSPASSGRWLIQLVSPRAPIRAQGLSYMDRLQFVRHEVTHLVLNEINPRLPSWLEEGVPTYESSASFYHRVCQRYLGREVPVPPFATLVQHYDTLKGADLLAFVAVEYVIARYGRGPLNRILRAPDQLESILGVSFSDFDRGWRTFIRDAYGTSAAGS